MIFMKDLESVLREIMAGWDIPGLAVGLVRNGEMIYAKGFGVQSLETQAPVTLDTVFCVQSIFKCLVATAVMQMVERGKIDLNAPLVQYLPYFRIDDERYRQITIRQMLSHTSGMPDIDEIDYVYLITHSETDDGVAERFVRSLSFLKLISNPGDRFSYSNIAYNVLGDLLRQIAEAKVSGKSFEQVMKEQILIPAGMPNSSFLLSEIPRQFADVNNLAMPHLRSPEMKVNPTYPYHRADAPASFLHTTVKDVCQWAIVTLKRGVHHEGRILSPETYDLMWTAVVERGRTRPSIYEEMGLGWTLGHIGDAKTIAKQAVSAALHIDPEREDAIKLLVKIQAAGR